MNIFYGQKCQYNFGFCGTERILTLLRILGLISTPPSSKILERAYYTFTFYKVFLVS